MLVFSLCIILMVLCVVKFCSDVKGLQFLHQPLIAETQRHERHQPKKRNRVNW
jgi:hypothetical protein